MYKEFKNTRVCAIDFYPSFLEALKDTYTFCKKYSIPLKGKGSSDVQKFFYHYCLEKFCSAYKSCKSKYPKAIVVYPLPKNIPFKEQSLKKILNVLPVPWVKCSSFNSPDIEMAITRATSNNKLISQKLNKFANKHKLVQFLQKSKNIKLFSNGTVDLSQSTE